jgi:hypothetical protein
MRLALRVVAGLVLGLMLVCAAALLFVRTKHGSDFAAHHIEHLVSRAIPGKMTIGRLERMSLRDVEVSDLRFVHPDGSLVLRAKHARIRFDLGAALHRELAFDHAEVTGGFLLVGAQPSGRTGLEETFAAGADKKTGAHKRAHKKDARQNGLRMQLRDMHVANMTVAIRPSPEHPFHLDHVRGALSIEHLDTKGVRVRLEHVSGELHKPEFLGKQLEIVSAGGWVHGAEPHVIDLNLETRLGEGKLDGHLALYHGGDKTPVELALAPKSGAATYAASIAAVAASWFSKKVDVDIED